MKKLMLFFALVICAVGCGKEGFSEGDRFGVINKFSHKGMICKSWEGELNIGGLVAGANGSMTQNIWRFSVRPSDEANVVATLQKAAELGKRVRVHYSQAYLDPVCETDTDYFVKSVAFVE